MKATSLGSRMITSSSEQVRQTKIRRNKNYENENKEIVCNWFSNSDEYVTACGLWIFIR